MPHKGEHRRSFTIEFKNKVVEHALRSSNRKAARRYDVDERRVREWRIKIDALTDVAQKQGGTRRKRLECGGRKLADNDLETDLLEWIHVICNETLINVSPNKRRT